MLFISPAFVTKDNLPWTVVDGPAHAIVLNEIPTASNNEMLFLPVKPFMNAK